jgi:hypothetical protein
VSEKKIRIKVTADEAVSFTVMFEPTGMTYELGPSEFMYAEVSEVDLEEMEIVQWEGGISIWPPGSMITTYDAEGVELHRL